MRPRTKFQKRVCKAAERLHGMTPAQRKWVEDNCIPLEAHDGGATAWCSSCGGVMKSGNGWTESGFAICPHCGKRLKVVTGRKRKIEHKGSFTVICTAGDLQVLRTYEYHILMRKGFPYQINLCEVHRYWMDEELNAASESRLTVMYTSDFSWASQFSLKPKVTQHWAQRVYPRISLLPLFRRNGYNVKSEDMISPVEALSDIVTRPFSETCMKLGYYALMVLYKQHDYLETAARIVVRNGWTCDDWAMWRDYIKMLYDKGKDLHNAHYVCPADLKAAHDRVLERNNRALERERIRIKNTVPENIQIYEKDYHRRIAGLLGVAIETDGVHISVLPNVRAFAEEGEKMHHCVYTLGYYARKDSLIFSARDDDGRRLETIEIDAQRGMIVQSRAVCNGLSERHDDIVRVVNENMSRILAAYGKKNVKAV